MIRIKNLTNPTAVQDYHEALNFVKSRRFINDGEAITIYHEDVVFVAIGKSLYKFVRDKEYNFAHEYDKEYFQQNLSTNEYELFIGLDISAKIRWDNKDMSITKGRRPCLANAYGNVYVCETTTLAQSLAMTANSRVANKLREYCRSNNVVPIYKARIDTSFSEIRKQYLSVGESVTMDNLSDGPIVAMFVNGNPRPERYVNSARHRDEIVTAKIYFKDDKNEPYISEIPCAFQKRIKLSLDPNKNFPKKEIFHDRDYYANVSFVKNMSEIYTIDHGEIGSAYAYLALVDCSYSDGVIYADIYTTHRSDEADLKKAKIIKPITSHSDDLVIFN